MKALQHEMPIVGTVFNLAGEACADPWRLDRENWERAKAAEEGRAFAARCQLKLIECPGFVGSEAPSAPGAVGTVTVDPRLAIEAREWLGRRFHVNDAVEIDRYAEGLVLEIIPRAAGKRGGARKAPAFRAEQFNLAL